MSKLAQTTVDLFRDLTTPLVRNGALNKSEHSAAMQLLAAATKPEPQNKAHENRLLTRGDAAERLGVCRVTVSRMVKSGELEGFYLRPGSCRSLRIKPDSINKLMDGGRK